MKSIKSESNSTSSSNVTTFSSWFLEDSFSDSAASSNVGLASSINWTSSVSSGGSIGWSCYVLSGSLNSLSDKWTSNNWWWVWNVSSLVDCLGSNSTLWWNISSLDIASLDVFSLSSNVVVSFWVVNNLSFDWKILNSFPDPFNRFIFNNCFFDFLWNVFNLSFNGIIISDGSLNRNSFSSGDFFIFNNFSFIWNSFDSFNLIVFNVFLFKWNIFYSRFNWNLLSNNFLGQTLSQSGVSSRCLECLVDKFWFLSNSAICSFTSIGIGASTNILGSGDWNLRSVCGSFIDWSVDLSNSHFSSLSCGVSSGVDVLSWSVSSLGVGVEEALGLVDVVWHGY